MSRCRQLSEQVERVGAVLSGLPTTLPPPSLQTIGLLENCLFEVFGYKAPRCSSSDSLIFERDSRDSKLLDTVVPTSVVNSLENPEALSQQFHLL